MPVSQSIAYRKHVYRFLAFLKMYCLLTDQFHRLDIYVRDPIPIDRFHRKHGRQRSKEKAQNIMTRPVDMSVPEINNFI